MKYRIEQRTKAWKPVFHADYLDQLMPLYSEMPLKNGKRIVKDDGSTVTVALPVDWR